MSTRVVVSLLDAHDSERLLRAVHRNLRTADAAEIAVVSPPEPSMGMAALSHRDLTVVVSADGEWLERAGAASARCYVWCRDDVEAEALPSSPAVAVVAASVEELAWELVRRLTGDLRDAHARPRETSAQDSGRAGPEPPSTSFPSAPSVVAAQPAGPLQRRSPGERRLPRTPSWAQIARSDMADRASASHLIQPDTRGAAVAREVAETQPPSNGDRTARQPSAEPTTPLAALAQRLRASQAPRLGAPPPKLARANGRARGWGGIEHVRGLLGRIGSPGRSEPDLSSLGQALVRFHSTLVVVGTPKGGPGKTTEAAALGVLGARAVEPLGGSAVLIDANIGNPDAWRQLGVPADALTLAEIMDALSRGIVVPNGEFARNERLRVLPERRTAGRGYLDQEIGRLEQHVRLRHTLIIVDLANSLPDLGGSPAEALVAHWLVRADIVVIPIDLGEASIVAAGEMLDAVERMVANGNGTLRLPGLVMPLLVPPQGRRALELPVLAEVLDHFRGAGALVVEVPYSVDVQTASHRHVPLVGASRRADRGFAGVLAAVVAARQARGPEVRHG